MTSVKSLSTLLLLTLVSIQNVLSQSPTQAENRGPHVQSVQPQPHVVEGSSNVNGKSQESAQYTPYAYRSSHPSTGSSTSYPSYPAATYNRDTFGTSRDVSSGSPLFGVSSNADFQLSAYFGQIFWGIVAVTLTLVVSIWVIRFFAGTDVVGGLVDRIRDSSPTGRSLDLDGVTNMVYEAFETYGKWAAKEARHAEEINASNKGGRRR